MSHKMIYLEYKVYHFAGYNLKPVGVVVQVNHDNYTILAENLPSECYITFNTQSGRIVEWYCMIRFIYFYVYLQHTKKCKFDT